MLKVNSNKKRYVSLPVTIEAYQWHHVSDYCEGVNRDVDYFRHPDVDSLTRCKYCSDLMGVHGWISTLEGGHIVCPNDFIITGLIGEKYPCKEMVFIQKYVETK